jgi:hypothetical protein
VYNVYRTYNLIYVPFENISGDRRWPDNTIIDLMPEEWWKSSVFYYIDVRLDE